MTKKTKLEACAVPCKPGGYKETMYLSLKDKDVAQVKTLNVGDKVEIIVTGTVKGLSQRERTDYDDSTKTYKSGDIDLVDFRVRVLDDSEADAFAELTKED